MKALSQIIPDVPDFPKFTAHLFRCIITMLSEVVCIRLNKKNVAEKKKSSELI